MKQLHNIVFKATCKSEQQRELLQTACKQLMDVDKLESVRTQDIPGVNVPPLYRITIKFTKQAQVKQFIKLFREQIATKSRLDLITDSKNLLTDRNNIAIRLDIDAFLQDKLRLSNKGSLQVQLTIAAFPKTVDRVQTCFAQLMRE